jgi:hypothetical protein
MSGSLLENIGRTKIIVRVNQVKAYSRGKKRKSFFFSLFLRKNKTIKCLKHCVRFELTTEDPRYKAFPERCTNTYERDEKKKKKTFFLDFFTKPSPKLSLTLKIAFETGVANANPRRSLNLNASNNKNNKKKEEAKAFFSFLREK